MPERLLLERREPVRREDPVAGPHETAGLAIEHEAKRLDADGSVDRRGHVPPLEQLHARDAAMPGRERVQDEPSAHGGLATQHDAVAAGGHDALGERSQRDAPGRGRLAQDVPFDAWVSRPAIELAGRRRAGRRPSAPGSTSACPGHLVPFDPGNAHRDALPDARRIAICTWRCGRERPGPDGRGEGVAHADLPDHSVPRTVRSRAAKE
jgi:hypothetical protein